MSGQQEVVRVVKCEDKDEMLLIEHGLIEVQFTKHPNIIDYKEVKARTDEEGKYWVDIVMPYYEGQDLAQYLSTVRAPVPAWRVLKWGNQLASALHFLHNNPDIGKPLVHRDLNPLNVLLAEDEEQCIIINFESWGKTGAAGGTSGFSAPEVVCKKSEATPAADVWSLGAILFVLLAPDFPMAYNAINEPQCLNSTTWDPNDFEDSLRRMIPKNYIRELVDLVVRMLSHDPQSRPESSEVLSVLSCLDQNLSTMEATSQPDEQKFPAAGMTGCELPATCSSSDGAEKRRDEGWEEVEDMKQLVGTMQAQQNVLIEEVKRMQEELQRTEIQKQHMLGRIQDLQKELREVKQEQQQELASATRNLYDELRQMKAQMQQNAAVSEGSLCSSPPLRLPSKVCGWCRLDVSLFPYCMHSGRLHVTDQQCENMMRSTAGRFPFPHSTLLQSEDPEVRKVHPRICRLLFFVAFSDVTNVPKEIVKEAEDWLQHSKDWLLRPDQKPPEVSWKLEMYCDTSR